MPQLSTRLWGLGLLAVIAIVSFSASFLILPPLIKISTRWRIFDLPSKHKIHTGFKPSVGGIAILIGVFTALVIVVTTQEWRSLYIFLTALAMMSLVGLSDDFFGLRPMQKIVGQLLPVLTLVFFEGIVSNTSYEFLRLQIFEPWLSIVLSGIAIIIITNAYNLIDGLDGLAGLIGVLCLSFFGGWFYLAGDYIFSLVIFSFVGPLAAFLIFNWQPAKVFMGDTGTLSIGMLLAYCVIKFININQGLEAEHMLKFEGSVATMICVLIIPVFDTSRIIILRIRKQQSPLRADNNHLHHRLAQKGFTHAQTVYLLLTINLLFVSIAILLKEQSDFVILSIAIIFCALINFVLERQGSYERKNIELNRRG